MSREYKNKKAHNGIYRTNIKTFYEKKNPTSNPFILHHTTPQHQHYFIKMFIEDDNVDILS